MSTFTRKLYSVSIVDRQADGSSVGLAVWERFGSSESDVLASTKDVAEREFPAANVDVSVDCVLPYQSPPSLMAAEIRLAWITSQQLWLEKYGDEAAALTDYIESRKAVV